MKDLKERLINETKEELMRVTKIYNASETSTTKQQNLAKRKASLIQELNFLQTCTDKELEENYKF